MSLPRETAEAVITECEARIAQLQAVVEVFRREFLGAPIQVAPIAGEVAAEPRKPRAARAVKPRQVALAPAAKERRKPGPKPKARPTIAAEPAQSEPAGDDAAALKSLRQSCGMSQDAAGVMWGYKHVSAAASISRMEKGEQPVPPGLLDKLRQLLRDKKLGDRGKVAS